MSNYLLYVKIMETNETVRVKDDKKYNSEQNSAILAAILDFFQS